MNKKKDPCTLQQIKVSHIVATFVAPCNDRGIESRRASTPNDTCGCYSHRYYCLVCVVDLKKTAFISKTTSLFHTAKIRSIRLPRCALRVNEVTLRSTDYQFLS